MKKGRKYREAAKKINTEKFYELGEGLALVRQASFAKFDETVELSANLKIKASQSVRDTLVLPHQFAEEQRVLVFAKGEKAADAEAAGAACVGAEELVQKIKDGWMDFDVCVATPDMMREVGKLGPILGRRGLMPNPKTRTVTTDVKAAVAELKKGRIEFRADKGGVVHLAVGKLSMEDVQIAANVKTFVVELAKRRPTEVKGDFIKALALSSTMGPGVKIKVQV